MHGDFTALIGHRLQQMRFLTILIVMSLALGVPFPAKAASADDQEIRIGQEYARRLEAQYKLVTDRAVVDRVARIGQEVALVSDRPGLPYVFKVIDLDVPNALALPGGFVYVTKAMLSFVRSDHELAAVLAHEIAHTGHRHQMAMIHRSNQAAFFTILVAVLTRDANIARGAQVVSAGMLSGYTRDMEREADLTSIAYLVKTDHTPVAALTVMERLRREERFRPQVDPGAFRDHPRTEERVAYIEAELRRRGILLIRRVAANYLRIATRTVTEHNRQVGELLVNDTIVLRLPDPARIAAVAVRLDRFFNTDPQPYDVSAREVEGGWGIFGGLVLLLTVTPTDAVFLGGTPTPTALTIQARLRWVIDQDLRMRRFNG